MTDISLAVSAIGRPRLSLESLIKIFREAVRNGGDTDVPEGTRYIIISDTLTADIIEALEALLPISPCQEDK